MTFSLLGWWHISDVRDVQHVTSIDNYYHHENKEFEHANLCISGIGIKPILGGTPKKFYPL
jgi:hypothetical protein